MKYNRLIILLTAIFLFNIILVNADSKYLTESIQGLNYGSGRIKTHVLDGVSYTFELVGCNEEKVECAILINGQTTGPLTVSDTYNLDNNYYIKVDSIQFDFCDNRKICDIYYEAYDIVVFSIFSRTGFCGDNECGSEEDCVSCPDDCGDCQIVCGDGICYPYETCEPDNCCSGIEVNFDDDYTNCGQCGKRCDGYEMCVNGECVQVCGNGNCESNEDCNSCEEDCGKCKVICGDGICQTNEDCLSCTEDCSCESYEKCEQGKCVTFCGNNRCESDEDCSSCIQDCACKNYEKCEDKRCLTYCGNSICESNEDCSSCQADCGCDGGYECFNKTCIILECNSDEDCDDEDPCTLDMCSGTPKKCSNKKTSSGCDLNGNCVPIGTRSDDKYCDIDNSLKDQKSKEESCNNNYECSSNICVNRGCISPNLIQKIINWFKKLFGG